VSLIGVKSYDNIILSVIIHKIPNLCPQLAVYGVCGRPYLVLKFVIVIHIIFVTVLVTANYTFLLHFSFFVSTKGPNLLRIGHTRLTHFYLIEHTDPRCTDCN